MSITISRCLRHEGAFWSEMGLGSGLGLALGLGLGLTFRNVRAACQRALPIGRVARLVTCVARLAELSLGALRHLSGSGSGSGSGLGFRVRVKG